MSLIDDILNNIDIVDIIWRYVNLKKVWSNYVALCPFHKEKTPSFVVSPDKQIFKCFWCWIGWNAIKFIMEYEKVDFWDAIKILAKEAWIDIKKYQKFETKEEKQGQQKEKFLLINKYAQQFFTMHLKKSEIAFKYLTQERKLDDKIIEKFWLGYAPDSFYQLVERLLWKWFEAEDLLKIWLAKKNSSGQLYAFFKNRIMFPIRDHMWNLVAFAWRIIDPNDNPKYLNTPETTIYDKSKILYWLNIAKNYIRDWWKIIIVEWYMDVIGLARANAPIWVASCWTALTPNHIKLLKRYTENIVFWFDNDEAWITATIRWLKIAYENEIYPKIFSLPKDFKDFDEAVNKLWPNGAQQILKDESNYSDWFEWLIKNLQNKYNFDDVIERKKFFNDIFEVLSSLKDYNILNFYLEKLSITLKISQDQLFRQFKTFLRKKPTVKVSNEKKNTVQPESQYLLWALIYDEFREKLLTKSSNNHTKNSSNIIQLLIAIAPYLKWTLLDKIVEESLTSEEIEKIKEAQLWWEKQQDEKIWLVVFKFLHTQIQKLLKYIVKLPNITSEEKNEFIKQLKNILKLQ